MKIRPEEVNHRLILLQSSAIQQVFPSSVPAPKRDFCTFLSQTYAYFSTQTA